MRLGVVRLRKEVGKSIGTGGDRDRLLSAIVVVLLRKGSSAMVMVDSPFRRKMCQHYLNS